MQVSDKLEAALRLRDFRPDLFLGLIFLSGTLDTMGLQQPASIERLYRILCGLGLKRAQVAHAAKELVTEGRASLGLNDQLGTDIKLTTLSAA